VAQLKLPSSIATKSDLVAVLRNVEVVLDNYVENRIRQQEGVDFSSRPDVTSNLAKLIAENKLAVSVEVLKSLAEWLEHLNQHAPVVRFTFASDPDEEFIARLVDWLRTQTGQFVIIRFGIQPTIAAGCLMYTPGKRYDFSLRSRLLSSGAVFAKSLAKILPAPVPAAQTAGGDQ